MQHLDEGTIHAWLDGALTADEAARAEAHVNDCPQCQAAVAEARGFIAASSRILTALDNAPRGVIPAAAPARRVQPWVWRVAATVLVVAGGTLLLARPRAAKMPSTVAADSIPESAVGVTAPTTLSQSAAAPANSQRESAQNLETAASAAGAAPASAEHRGAIAPPRTATPAAAPTRVTVENDFSGRVAGGGARLDQRREAVTAKTTGEPSPVSSPVPQANAFGVATDVAVGTPREVEMKRTAGGTRTLYEIAAGDTVMLEEQSGGELQNIAATGAVGAASSRRAQPMVVAGKSAAVAQSQQKTEAAAAAPPPAPPTVAAMQDAQVAEVHRISWLDRATGRVLILSGRHSQDELQQIRAQIQRLRDAAAQSKKVP